MGGAIEVLPGEYGYVTIVLLLYCFLNFYMAGQVGRARKRYNVPYPALYASESENKDAKIFNCIQRGHQNTLENMPVFFLLMLLGGIRHPLACAVFGLIYAVFRYFYFTGYATGIPDKRNTLGKYSYIGLLGLLGCTISTATGLLLHK